MNKLSSTLSLIFMCLIANVSCQAQVEPVSGDDGIGDSYYPQLGNSGYDVRKYTIILDIDPESNTVDGQTIIEAKATDRLKSFNLDFEGLTVKSVSVNKSKATFQQEKAEMTVTPRIPIARGHTFIVQIQYHGKPTSIRSQAISGGEVGWFHAEDGTINVFAEPDGASTWFPNNNRPRDKAMYRFDVRVPNPWIVAATGTLTKTIPEENHTRYLIELNDPAASYLVSINIDKYIYNEIDGPHGIRIRSYFPTNYPESLKDNFDKLPEIIEYLVGVYGPYPFEEYGVVIASPDTAVCTWAAALETQSLSIHCPNSFAASEGVIVHEVAHQWFGDSVSLENWKDIWLKEGMATYAEWLWNTRANDLEVLTKIMKNQLSRYYGSTPIADPPTNRLYGQEVYEGGALAFHALRLKVGEEAFFKILREYLDRYQDSHAGTDEFITLAEEISGQDLQEFFDLWLFSEKLPEFPE